MDLTLRLRGKRVAAVMTNGHLLNICTEDGAELTIAWVDDNGVPIKGKPVVAQHGVRLKMRGLQDLINLPQRVSNTRRNSGESL